MQSDKFHKLAGSQEWGTPCITEFHCIDVRGSLNFSNFAPWTRSMTPRKFPMSEMRLQFKKLELTLKLRVKLRKSSTSVVISHKGMNWMTIISQNWHWVSSIANQTCHQLNFIDPSQWCLTLNLDLSSFRWKDEPPYDHTSGSFFPKISKFFLSILTKNVKILNSYQNTLEFLLFFLKTAEILITEN